MRIKLTLLLLFLLSIVQGQEVIKGKVVDEFNNPIPYVSVILKGTTQGTATDDEGFFAFKVIKKKGVLELSLVGFQTKTIPINRKTKFLNILLQEENNVLEEIVVVTKPKKRLKKKQNPAYRILKEIWKRKRKNGTDLANQYQFKKHTITEIGINNIDSTFIKTLFKTQYKEVMKEVQYDSDGVNYYIPVYMHEQVSKVYGNNRINKYREDIEAEKKEGIGTDGFLYDRIKNTFNRVDVFKNNINILQKSFVSPLSTSGFATYDYLLYDSIIKNNKKLYNIYYFPIRDEDLAFKGNFWVSDSTFSIHKINLKVTKSANLNYVRGLTFKKEFAIKNDSVYLETRNFYEGDFTFLDKRDLNKGLTIKKTIVKNDYILNKKLPKDFYDVEIKKIKPNQYKKGQVYWNKLEGNTSKKTYQLISSVKEKRKIKRLTSLLNIVTTGFVPISKTIQIGNLLSAFGKNSVEGIRTKVELRTFRTKDDRFRLHGHMAYGFKDQKVKYGVEAKYLLSYQPRISTAVVYQTDIEQLGSYLFATDRLFRGSFGNTPIIERGNNFFLSNVEKYAVNFDFAIHDNFHVGINLSRSDIISASPKHFSISYYNDNNQLRSSVINSATDLYVNLTPGRFVYGLGVQQLFGKNIYPTIGLNYRRGYKGLLGGTHTYHKLQIKYSQPLLLGQFGKLDAFMELGKTIGKVPVSLLNPIPANQSYFLRKNTFSLLNHYDYVTDTYITGHFEHHFNGFILNRIPLFRKLKLRGVATFRTFYGTISNENRTINDSALNQYSTENIIYNTPKNHLYYEYGFGIENIGYGNLRLFRVDAIWRSDYTPAINSLAQPSPKFAIRVGIRPEL